jgi:hypothetical protein
MEGGMMIYVRIHSNRDERILAACDEDVLGNTYRGNGIMITVNDEFYNGELVPEEAFVERMRSATIMNLVGERTISLAIENGFVDEDCVLVIGETKHAQVVKG